AKGAFLSSFGGICWALSGTFGQYLFEVGGFDAIWLTTVRLLAAGFIMLGVSLIKNGKATFDIWKDKRDIFEIIVYGLLGMAGVQITYFGCIQFSNAATGTIIQYIGSVVIVLYVALRAFRLPARSEVAALILAIGGLFILSTHGDIHTLVFSEKALIIGLVSACLMAFYSLQPRRMLKKFDTLRVNGWGMMLGGILMFFIRQPWELGGGTLDLKCVLATVGVVLLGTIMSFFCYMEGVRIIGSDLAVLYAAVEPLTAAVVGILWFHIPWGFMDWIGAAMIVSTVFIISLAPRWANKKAITKEGVS
ncbi:MAG: EamA family transporter, partial [Firmicutes bacterium]|nr:EamA family transporter [Bacillota bacterium]